MIDSFFLFKLLNDITINFNNDCICDRRKNKIIEPFKITDTRTELRCRDCKGLIGWWDEPSKVKKVVVPKREWTEQERNELV